MARIKPQALLLQSKKKRGPSRLSVATFAVYVLVVLLMALFLFATYRYWTQREHLQRVEEVEKTDFFEDPKKIDSPNYVVIKTSKGSITAELHKEGSPEVVASFIKSCRQGHFKGMLFNRVIKNFVIQGGEVSSRPGIEEDWTSRENHYNQLDTSLKHEAFMLGTSKRKTDGGAFDLFITTAPIPDLNVKMNVFGRVVEGEDVVQEIEEADTDDHYQPKTPIGIIEMTLQQKL